MTTYGAIKIRQECLNIIIVIALLLFIGVAGTEANTNAPSWYDTDETGMATFYYSTNSNPAIADVNSNLVSKAVCNIELGPFASGWMDTSSGASIDDGSWDMGAEGTMQFDMQFSPEQITVPYTVDYMIDVFCFEVGGFWQPPTLSLSDISVSAEPVYTYGEEYDSFMGGYWRHYVWEGRVEGVGNDVFNFTLTSAPKGSLIEDVTAYEFMIPEPSSTIFMVLAFAFAFGWQRSRNSNKL